MDQTEITERLIDIEALFAAKNPRILKIIPAFVIRYLKRITHQEAINGYIYKHRNVSGLPFIDAILEEFGVNIVAEGIGPVNESSRYIIAANHPLGGMDGMALMKVAGKIWPDIVFPVNDLLMNVPGLRSLFIPVNKHGRNTENARIIAPTFASNKTILYFPAGLCSRKRSDDTICDLEWKKTFITKARQYKRDVIPVYIEGRNSDWFYNLSKWRKSFGIKTNIEMLYLVDEMMKQRDKTIRLIFGKIIPYPTFDKSRTDTEWAEWVKQKTYKLKVTSDDSFSESSCGTTGV